ncbi:MAG: hypothetical protein ACRCSN_18860 [Dermatophilaceae bacterium]
MREPGSELRRFGDFIERRGRRLEGYHEVLSWSVADVPGIPRTHTGKRIELPVKRILQGRPVDEALQTETLANPAVLDGFVAAATRHRAERRAP